MGWGGGRVGEDDRHRDVAITVVIHGCAPVLRLDSGVGCVFVFVVEGGVRQVTVMHDVLEILEQLGHPRREREHKHKHQKLAEEVHVVVGSQLRLPCPKLSTQDDRPAQSVGVILT